MAEITLIKSLTQQKHPRKLSQWKHKLQVQEEKTSAINRAILCINPLFPEAQNVVTDTEAEDNGNINLLVPEAQNGVADTTAVDNGNTKPSLPEA
ncbi:hypothetical protein Tco_0926009 [Tanacetum coccineum]|uniref:Uncharacterized protein n=1 Tax=Tanacetum coccineum TaxID=301880 RepID=A0ABQ5D9P9_9ASTR